MTIWGRMFLATVSLLLLIFLLPGCGVPKEEYQKIERDLAVTQTQLSQTRSELAQRNADVQQLDGELASLRNQYNDLLNDYDELESRYDKSEAELTSLNNQYDALQNNYDEIYDDYSELDDEYLELLADYTSTLDEYISALEELGQSLQVPYTAVSGREITCAWEDMDGELHMWTWPVDSYRAWIEIPKPDGTVLLDCAGTVYTFHDFVPYVRAEFFNAVISSFYQESTDEREFAQEIFNLVTQLAVYSEEIGEVPRWPVETLTEGGGDCEDLAILFASLLKAAPYPYKLSLIYMDIDNPTDPQMPNHVIVEVSTDDWLVFAECTSDQGWGYYEIVEGWYYEL